jgi:diguanylate cyclase (GGDEF)-like protein/PAS domain S-box-containing protein
MSALAGAALSMALLAMLPVSYWVSRVERVDHDLRHQVEHAGNEVAVHIRAKLNAIELVLRGVRGFVEGSDAIRANEFRSYVSSLQIEQTASGLLGVAYVPYVRGGELAAFELDARTNMGTQGFRLRPAGQRIEYAPILFIEPPTGNNVAALGLDILTVNGAREAALRARDSGQTSLSNRLVLAQDGMQPEVGFVMYLPIHNPGQKADTPFQRQASLRGWGDAPFRLKDILQSHSGFIHPDLRLQLFEGDQPSARSFLLGLVNGRVSGFQDDTATPYSSKGTIEFGGQRWTYTLDPTPAFVRDNADRSHHWFAALGLLLSLAAGTIVWLLMSSRDRAQASALDMTRELRQLSSDMEGTLNAVPDLLFELDREGRYLALRTRTEDGLVLPREELIGKRTDEILPPAAAQGCLRAIAEAERLGVSTGQQIEIPINGVSRWFELSIARKNSGDTGEPRFIMLSRDITDRVKAAQRLQESERALTEAQRVAAIGHFWVDVLQRRWRGSPSVCELVGLHPGGDHALDEIAELVEPRCRQRFLAACATLAPDTPLTMEFGLVRASDGASRWMLMCGQSVPDGDGSGTRFFTLQDVTDRRRSAEQLKLLEKAVASLNDMVLITEAEPVDKPGPRIVFVNDAFERKTGYSREEVLGKSPRILQGPDTQRAELDRIRQALNAWQPVRAELINYTKNREPYWVELMIQPIADEQGWFTHWVSVERDVTERRSAEERVHQLAYYDGLTHLPNRSLFMLTAADALASRSRSHVLGAAILIDLDNFKVINDNWGHRNGDLLLAEKARCIREAVPPADTVARLGGDEFIVLLHDLGQDMASAVQEVERFCTRLLGTVSRPVTVDGIEHFASASLGAVVFGDTPLSVEELLSRADSAMYSAKDSGRNTHRFFDGRLQAQIAERVALEIELRQSIERQELFLLYQPQVDSEGRVVGAEALCRWNHAKRGAVSPALFIPLAEDSGFIHEMGPWVLKTACAFLAQWPRLPGMEKLSLSVNVSARQFHHPEFVRHVHEALTHSGANPRQLKLELTESIFADDIEDIVKKMETLRALGVRFSLDDFGTGYSSLSYLKKLPLDQLKIDQSFVRDVLLDTSDEAIVRTVIALGESLGLNVIAEGVETTAQRDFLLRSGCSLYQGYLFSRPIPPAELAAFANPPV